MLTVSRAPRRIDPRLRLGPAGVELRRVEPREERPTFDPVAVAGHDLDMAHDPAGEPCHEPVGRVVLGMIDGRVEFSP